MSINYLVVYVSYSMYDLAPSSNELAIPKGAECQKKKNMFTTPVFYYRWRVIDAILV